jgi:hypothetical protein
MLDQTKEKNHGAEKDPLKKQSNLSGSMKIDHFKTILKIPFTDWASYINEVILKYFEQVNTNN